MADELSKSEEAAFAAMQEADQANTQPPEPEADGEADSESAPESAAGGDAGEERRQKYVPHEALHEERLRRQAVEAENRRLAEERARFDERLRIIMDMNGPRSEARAKPDLNADPLGAIAHIDQRLAAMEAGSAQQAAEVAEAAQVNQLAEVARAEAWEFARKTPDYNDAYNHFVRARDAELAVFGYPPAMRANLITQEELQIAAQSFAAGRSPAETLYTLAKARGFRPKAGGEGGAGDQAEAQIDRIAAGQSRGKTLSVGGGGAAGGEMTAAKLLAMSNDEFDAWTSRNPAKARRLMGG